MLRRDTAYYPRIQRKANLPTTGRQLLGRTTCLNQKIRVPIGCYYDEGEPDYDEEDGEEFGPSWTVYVRVKCIPSHENVINTQQALGSIVNDLVGKVDGWELKLSKV